MRFENTDFKILRPGTGHDFLAAFTRLVSMNQSLTEDDEQTVAWFADAYGPALPLPDTIPFKETLCVLAVAAKGLDVPAKAPTDLLRVAVFRSGGDGRERGEPDGRGDAVAGLQHPDERPRPADAPRARAGDGGGERGAGRCTAAVGGVRDGPREGRGVHEPLAVPRHAGASSAPPRIARENAPGRRRACPGMGA